MSGSSVILITLSVVVAGSADHQANTQWNAATREFEPLIIGGSRIPIETTPWQVSLSLAVSDTLYILCGGSIIDATWILTAAHCFFDSFGQLYPNPVVTVKAGSPRLSGTDKNRQVRTAARIIIHDRFDPEHNTGMYDVALLELSQSLYLSPQVQIIPLASYLDVAVFVPGSSVLVSGWGWTSTAKTSSSSDFLNAVNDTVVHTHECSSTYSGLSRNTQIVCTFRPGKGSCSGDSGGPLAALNGSEYILVGIVSQGAEMCLDGPSIYVAVAVVRPWIMEQCPTCPHPVLPPAPDNFLIDADLEDDKLFGSTTLKGWSYTGTTARIIYICAGLIVACTCISICFYAARMCRKPINGVTSPTVVIAQSGPPRFRSNGSQPHVPNFAPRPLPPAPQLAVPLHDIRVRTPTVPMNELTIRSLVVMGVTRDQAVCALQASHNNVNVAAVWIFEKIRCLTEMGVSQEQAVLALEANGNDVARAGEWLLDCQAVGRRNSFPTSSI